VVHFGGADILVRQVSARGVPLAEADKNVCSTDLRTNPLPTDPFHGKLTSAAVFSPALVLMQEASMAGKIPLSRVYQSELIDRRILDVVHGGIQGVRAGAGRIFWRQARCALVFMDGGGAIAAHRARAETGR
jgi:hypothetical protein